MSTPTAPTEARAVASPARVPWKAVGWIGGLSAPIGVAVNLLLYVLADAAGWLDPVTRPHGRPITEVEVIVATVIGVLGAIGVYVALARLTRHPARNFTFIAAATLAVSFIPPTTLADAPAQLVAVLVAMHVVTASLCVATVWAFGRPEQIARRVQDRR